jgi:hypothetical protein
MPHDFDDTAYDTVIGPDHGHGGMPPDRAARLAARRAFVEMKLLFLRAVAPLEDRKGEWLRNQLRLASEPVDLWLLRGPVLRALSLDDQQHRALRTEIYRHLDKVFPEAFRFDPGARPSPSLPGPWETIGTEVRRSSYIR